MNPYLDENSPINKAINDSFNRAFKDYEQQFIDRILEVGETVPIIITLEMDTDSPESIIISGKQHHIDATPIRDFVYNLGKKYIVSLLNKKSNKTPVGLIVGSEAYMSTDKSDKTKRLQDKDGKAINGATEKLLVSALSVTGVQKVNVYEITRDADNKIIGLTIDNIGISKLENVKSPMLKGFYRAMADYMGKKTEKKIKELKKQLKDWEL